MVLVTNVENVIASTINSAVRGRDEVSGENDGDDEERQSRPSYKFNIFARLWTDQCKLCTVFVLLLLGWLSTILQDATQTRHLMNIFTKVGEIFIKNNTAH